MRGFLYKAQAGEQGAKQSCESASFRTYTIGLLPFLAEQTPGIRVKTPALNRERQCLCENSQPRTARVSTRTLNGAATVRERTQRLMFSHTSPAFPTLSRVLTFGLIGICSGLLLAQDAAQPVAKPADRLIGEITAVDTAGKKITVKDDATKAEYSVSLADTKTFLRVPPGEKDLKKATRIDAEALSVGDRVALRGKKTEDSKTFEAASVLLMTAGDLAKIHQAELQDWQKRGSSGTLTAIDAAARQATMTVRGADGQKTVTVSLPDSVEYMRYSPASVKMADAKPGTIADLQPGDQVRVLGNKNDDGTTIAAEKVFSGSFRTIPATIVSISPDGKEIKINDLQTKQPVIVALTDDSVVRRLPPMMAQMLAMRLNPAYKAQGASGGPGGPPGAPGSGNPAAANSAQGNSGAGAPAGAGPGNGQGGNGQWAGGQGQSPAAGAGPGGPGGSQGGAAWAGRPGGGGGMRSMNGDMSQMIERLPKISISELKPGDAVVVSGGSGTDKTHLTATNVIAGVEPLFVSAPPRAGQSMGSSWNLGVSDLGGAGGPQ